MYLLSVATEARRKRPAPRSCGVARFLLRNLLLLALAALPSFAQTQVGTLGATEPTQMAIDTDASGTRWLYVSQHGDIPTSGTTPTNGGVILKYNLTTGSTTPIPITSYGTGDGQFISPDGIAIDPATHDLFVADRYLSRIQRLHSDGTFVMKFGTPTAGAPDEMHGPCGLVLDSSGALYVTEHGDTQQPPFGTHGQHVSKYTFSGTGSSMTATRVWRIGSWGSGDGQFDRTGPYGITLNGSTILVADAFNNRIEVFDTATGNYLSQFSLPNGEQPLGLYRDSGGALWIAETSSSSPTSYDGQGPIQQVQKYSMSGTYEGVTLTGTPAFSLPFHTAIDPVTNKIYVTDYNNSRVVVFDGTSTGGGGTTSAPQITSSSTATAEDVHNFSYQITATNSPTSFAATDALPAGLTLNSSTGVISGVPAASATTTTTHLTATNSAGTSSTFALTITVNHPTPPTITAFNFVSHSSGQFEVTFSEPVTGVDLSDFTLTQGGNSTGALSSVTQVDPSHYDVNFTFYSGAPGAFTLSINPSGTGIVGVNSGLPYEGGGYTSAIVAVTPHLEVGAQYAPVVQSFAVDSSSGNTVYFKVQFNVGTWNLQPSNVTVNTVSGNATGTVGVIRSDDTAYSTSFLIPVTVSGSGSISLTLSNATQQTICDGNYNMYVGPDTSAVFTVPDSSTLAPTIAQPQTAAGTQNQPFYYQVAADYAASYAIDSSTPLPAGLSLNPTTGEITGVPSVSGSIPVTVKVTNPNGSITGSVTLDIAAGTSTGSAPTIANQSASGTQNQSFNYQVVASGATSYALTGSTPLPTGLSLDGVTGVISGTPSGSGSTTVTVQVTNSTGSASATVTINIAAATPTGSAPTIANQSASGTQNQAFNYQVVASGATSFSLASGSTLPAGLTMSSAGRIAGTPTASGSSTVVVDATNSYGTTPGNVTITIAAATPTGSAPTIAAQSASGTQNQGFNYQVVASGATSFSLASGSTLPAGLTMSSAGQIAGTPTATGSTTVVVDAANSYGTTPGNVMITIAAATPTGSAPTIAAQSASGTQNQAFSYQVVASGATSFSLASGSTLPAGLTMSSTGQITGTPTATGSTTLAVDATNSYGTTAGNVTITISATTPPPAAPVVTGGSISVTAGSPMTYTVKATNNPTSFSIVNQPVGLAISATGVISGTPSVTGTYNAKVTATNAGGSGSATLTIQVNASQPPPPPPPPVLTPQTITFVAPTSASVVGQTFALRAEASSGLPVAYALVSGPATLSGNTLLFTGAGSVVVRASQSGNSTYAAASTSVTIPVIKAAQAIDTTPVPAKVHTDAALTLDATSSSGLPITYTVVSGPATVSGDKVTFTGTGTVVLTATQPGNAAYAATTSTITLTANPVPRLVNISSRLKVSMNDADGASITGFVVTGDQPKPMLIRAVGPTLKEFGVAAPLGAPTLKLFDASGKVVATNSGWGDDANIAATAHTLGAFPLTAGSKDAAMLVTLAPGAYTAQVQSATGSGTVLIEVYDASATAAVPTKQLINISTRGTVGSGDDVLVGGFVVSGNEPKKVLVRAVGPALAAFGVKGALSDPILTVHAADGSVVATNDNWGTTSTVTGGTATSSSADVTAAESATGAFPLPSGSADAALVLTLPPGQYSAVVTGAHGANGAAMVEVYEVSSQ